MVDGDQHIRLDQDVKEALEVLENEGKTVRLVVFTAASKVKGLAGPFELLRVPRRGGGPKAQPNDEAIIARVEQAARDPGHACIALLVSDRDFLPAVSYAISKGKEVVVFIPHAKPAVTAAFRATGARVLFLARTANVFRVKAQLSHVVGTVELMEPVRHEETDASPLRDFLAHYGYCEPEAKADMLLAALAKFWFLNGTGRFTVFPYQMAQEDMRRLLMRPGRNWRHYSGDLAFFLPTRGQRRVRRRVQEVYGGGLAPSIYNGGGPFMLTSDELVPRALRRLGYLDDELNTDLLEAMQVFCNVSNNKGTLLRLSLLPTSSSTAEPLLREAMLQNPWGVWETVPSDREVVGRLCRGATPEKAMPVLGDYCEQQGLISMKTYHGRVWRILRSWDHNACRRETLEW